MALQIVETLQIAYKSHLVVSEQTGKMHKRHQFVLTKLSGELVDVFASLDLRFVAKNVFRAYREYNLVRSN